MIHLLEEWAAVADRLRQAKRALVMLDFDGTLAPIVPRPADARVPAATQNALRALMQCAAVELALVSGRGADDVRALAGLPDIHYFGSHGREHIAPGTESVTADQAGRLAIFAVCERLAAALSDVDGFQIENKGVSAAAHFRIVDASHRKRVERAVRDAVASVGSLNFSAGKMVFDITPDDGVNKGTAVLTLLREVGGLPLYFGDDTTDESAFRALPRETISVFVGPAGRHTQARYRLSDTAEVGRALSSILDVLCR